MSVELPPVHFEPAEEPVASVVVIGFRRAPYLLECLRALRASVREVPYEVLVVLNQPERELVRSVESGLSGAQVLRTEVNLGFGGALNRAATEARGEFLVFLNDDTEVMAGWLEALVDTARRRPEAGAVGSKLLFPDGTLQEAGSVIWADGSTVTVGRGLPGDSLRYEYERRVDFASGGSLLVRRELFEQMGGMDSSYFPAYYEDVDLCLRLAEIGRSTWFQPRSQLMHHESQSTNESFRAFLFARNRATFIERWAPVLEQREAAAPWDERAVTHAVWRAMGEPRRVLFIDDQVADASIGSGYPRMVDTLRAVHDSGRYHLAIFTSLVDGSRTSDLSVELGIEVLEGYLEEHLEQHLRGCFAPYDAVIVSRPHNFERFAPLVRALHPGTPIIYDAEALFHRRIERQAQMGADARTAAEAEEMRALEGKIAASSDLVVTISEAEGAFMREHATGPVRVHSALLAEPRLGAAGFSERADIAFVAGWAWGVRTPNVDALMWFARDVLPEVLARVPGARLLVTGSNAPEPVLRLAGPALSFTGRVADLEDFYASVRVAVVPMRYGSGVKIKTVEALQFGVPTVATSVGAEGIEFTVPDCLLVDDDPHGFALKVATLLGEGDVWDLQRARILAQHAHWGGEERPSVWPGVIDEVVGRAVHPARA